MVIKIVDVTLNSITVFFFQPNNRAIVKYFIVPCKLIIDNAAFILPWVGTRS